MNVNTISNIYRFIRKCITSKSTSAEPEELHVTVMSVNEEHAINGHEHLIRLAGGVCDMCPIIPSCSEQNAHCDFVKATSEEAVQL